MECPDEIDDLSVMLEPPTGRMVEPEEEATLAAANTDVTITINAHGEVNVDQAAIASVLGSRQQSAKVTFVRIGEEGATVENQVELDASELLAAVGGGAGGTSVEPDADMGLVLDQDAMNKLESVLQSDEGQNLLEKVASENQDGDGVGQDDEKPTSGPTRRSTRNQERETRQTAEKIKEENRRELESKKDEGRRGRGGRGRGRGRRNFRRRNDSRREDDQQENGHNEEGDSGDAGGNQEKSD